MTAICVGDREFAKSKVVCVLRKFADDIEKGAGSWSERRAVEGFFD